LQLYGRIDSRKILVGMHVRLGEFAPPTSLSDYRRVPNASLPIEWFRNIASSLQGAFGDDWQLLLVSDGRQEQLQELCGLFPCVITADLANGDCSDVLALAGADLLVCSASTYSSLAAFLSDSPYLWFAPNLHAHPEGCYSLHGDTPEHQQQGSPTQLALEYFVSRPASVAPRGVAVGMDGVVPAALLESVARRRDGRRWESDLVRCGVTPIAANSSSQRFVTTSGGSAPRSPPG
jgi:hypothetical protein